MIKKILIANRGEIALRIIKTCKKLNIQTVALASKAEQNHPHIRYADFHEIINKESPAEVYLDQKLIIKTAKKHKVDAIHPGYGFLAENSEFSRAVQEAGLIFIGPKPETLHTLGDKAQTRQLALELKVPVVPGYNGEKQDQESLLEQAKKIGFPIMLKAVMGGGGRGMRKVDQASSFITELESAKKEAERLYANADMCIEKFVEQPRHIEIQVAGDNHENYIHLFERDCSIQRRFQKVVEFTPANIEAKLLDQLYSHALEIAKGSKLSGLATMEFLVSSKSQDLYFLEANPRIQVEHPVTEIACNLDLVELQFIIANDQVIKNIKPTKNAFALQARIYAEAPEKNFIASSGYLRDLNLPNFEDSFSLNQNCRCDHALFKGFELNQDFDPMLSKILVSANSYEQLKENGLNILRSTFISGIDTNLPLLISLFESDQLYKLNIQDLESFKANYQTKDAAAVAAHLINNAIKSNSPFDDNWRKTKTETTFNYYVKIPLIDKEQTEIALTKTVKNELFINQKKINAELTLLKQSRFILYYLLNIDAVNYAVITANPDSNLFFINGRLHIIEKSKEKNKKAEEQKGILLSPLPGKITKIHIKAGQKVNKGESLISIESMKIEHNIRSSSDENEIESILVEEGMNVNFEQELLKFKQSKL